MKIVPALLDHPKFLRLKRMMGDAALEYLLRLWSHCESNQKGECWYNADAEYVEIVCRFSGENLALFNAFVNCGFIIQKRGFIIIHDWNATNSRAVTNWNLGTRDKKRRKSKDKPEGSLGLPLDSAKPEPMRSPLNEGMNERVNEEDSPSVSPKLPSRPVSRSLVFVDDAHIATLKTIYQAKDVDKAVAACKAWLLTPKGRGKGLTPRRLGTFLRDAEPISQNSEKKTAADFADLPEPTGWPKAWPEYADISWEDLPQDIQISILKKNNPGGEA